MAKITKIPNLVWPRKTVFFPRRSIFLTIFSTKTYHLNKIVLVKIKNSLPNMHTHENS